MTEKALYLFTDLTTITSSADVVYTETEESICFGPEVHVHIVGGSELRDILIQEEIHPDIINEGSAGREMVLFPNRFRRIGL